MNNINEMSFAQRTPAGLAYERDISRVRAWAKNYEDPTVKQANAEITRMKYIAPGNVHTNATLTNLAVKYKNDAFIGLELMPVVPVGKLSDFYYIYPKRSRLATPDTKLGHRGKANEVQDSREQATYSCEGYGLKNYVDAVTIANQDAPLDEMMNSTEIVQDMIDLDEELRIAAIMTDPSNYAGNTTAIAASSRWDTSGGGDPIADIQAASAALWNGAGRTMKVGFTSLDVWNVLSRHPSILDLFKYKGSTSGLATQSMVAQFLGLDRILVSEARKDTANSGQTASYSRIWGDVFGVVRVAMTPSRETAAFGFTFRMGPKRTDTWFDQTLGTQGAYYTRTTVMEDHKVVAGDTGYLIQNPIN